MVMQLESIAIHLQQDKQRAERVTQLDLDAIAYREPKVACQAFRSKASVVWHGRK